MLKLEKTMTKLTQLTESAELLYHVTNELLGKPSETNVDGVSKSEPLASPLDFYHNTLPNMLDDCISLVLSSTEILNRFSFPAESSKKVQSGEELKKAPESSVFYINIFTRLVELDQAIITYRVHFNDLVGQEDEEESIPSSYHTFLQLLENIDNHLEHFTTRIKRQVEDLKTLFTVDEERDVVSKECARGIDSFMPMHPINTKGRM